MLHRILKPFLWLLALIAISACDRDVETQTASLTINNMTNLGTAPLSIWSVYVTPTNSATPAIDRSVDLLASVDLAAGASRSFTIDTCGQQIDVQVIFSNGSELSFSSLAAVNCDSTYTCDADDPGIPALTCS